MVFLQANAFILLLKSKQNPHDKLIDVADVVCRHQPVKSTSSERLRPGSPSHRFPLFSVLKHDAWFMLVCNSAGRRELVCTYIGRRMYGKTLHLQASERNLRTGRRGEGERMKKS